MKQPEYIEGPKARENFERGMIALFKVPKTAIGEGKRKKARKLTAPRKKKASDKGRAQRHHQPSVEGYTQDKDASVEYVLDCVEVIANEPTPHTTIRCARVHSHSDYMVKLGDDFIAFGGGPSSQTEPLESAYRIKLEKEVRKK
jgi:hypothetical protein